MLKVRRSKRLDPLEYIFILWKGFMQLSVEFEKPSDTDKAVDEVLKCMNSFRIKTNYLSLIPTDNKPTIHKIPSDLKSLKDVNSWMYRTHTEKLTKAFGSIARDDHRIVVNSSHICNDGVYLARLIEHLSHPELYGTRNALSLPRSGTQDFEHDVFTAPDYPACCGSDALISRIHQKHHDTVSKYNIDLLEMPISKFASYNKEDDSIHNLSEALWTTMALANAAHNNRSLSGFGISTVLDLRRILSKEDRKALDLQNYIASMPVCGYPTMDMTIGDLSKRMRDDFNYKLKNKYYFGHMKSVHAAVFRFWKTRETAGLGIEMSSIGPIRIQNPVKDCCITLSSPDDKPLTSTSLMNYTIIDETKQTKKFVGQLQYITAELSERDANAYLKSIEYGFENFKDSMPISKAIDELAHFQASLI